MRQNTDLKLRKAKLKYTAHIELQLVNEDTNSSRFKQKVEDRKKG